MKPLKSGRDESHWLSPQLEGPHGHMPSKPALQVCELGGGDHVAASHLSFLCPSPKSLLPY